MKTTRILGLSLLTATLAIGAWAQSATPDTATAPQGRGRAGFEGRHGGPFGHLNLTEDQKSQFKTLMQNQRQQIDAIRQDTTLTDAQKHDKIAQIHQGMRAQFDAILTPEQKQQMAEGRHGGRRGDPLSALNLTDQQKAAAKPIFESAHNSMRSIQQDTTLTREQKFEKMKQLHQQTQSQLSAILTPDQLQQLKQLGPRGLGRRGPRNGQGTAPTTPQS